MRKLMYFSVLKMRLKFILYYLGGMIFRSIIPLVRFGHLKGVYEQIFVCTKKHQSISYKNQIKFRIIKHQKQRILFEIILCGDIMMWYKRKISNEACFCLEKVFLFCSVSVTDRHLTLINTFAQNKSYYQVPETIKRGKPIFYLTQNDLQHTLLNVK